MEFSTNSDYNSIIRAFGDAKYLGNLYFTKRLDDNNTLMIFEKFTFMNSNRMSLTIVVTKTKTEVNIVIKSTGSARGMLIRFDWGAGTSLENQARKLLEDLNLIT